MARMSLREKSEHRKKITHLRIETLIPKLMEQEKVDMWIISSGDFNDDPVIPYLLDVDPVSKTTIIFVLNEGKLEKYCNQRGVPYLEGEYYLNFLKFGESVPEGLRRLVEEKQPKRVALNMSEEFPILDGLTHTLYQQLAPSIGEERIISAEPLALAFMETRLPEEMEVYEEAARFARELMAEVMSPKVVKPGITTTLDIRWYMLEWMRERDIVPNWLPNVVFQRKGSPDPMIGNEVPVVIEKGDLLHIDFGINYLQMQTDMQYLAYILKDGETEAPKGLVDGFAACRRMQQIYLDTVREGQTGNALLHEMLDHAEKEGLEAMVYSHPIGFHAHAVGPSMGRFGQQHDIPHGKYVVHDNTCFAMEMNVQVRIPEWNDQKIFIFREEDITIKNGKAEVIGALQPELWTI